MPRIALFPGDGVGPEVIAEAVKVLGAVERRFACSFSFEQLAIGGDALDRYGVPLRAEDIEVTRGTDAALLGAVGGPRWDAVESSLRPERGLLQIRKALALFANLRPVAVLPALVGASPLKPEIVSDVDLLIVRELTGGIYFGEPSNRWSDATGRAAVDTLTYREHEIERVVRLAFEFARERRGHVASVDKSNVLQSSRLWREIVDEVSADYPQVEARARVGRRDGYASDQESETIRCNRDGEYVRRHSYRRSVGTPGLDWPSSFGQPERPTGERKWDAVWSLRADPRECAGHRRQGPGQPSRSDPVGSLDDALVVGVRRGCKRDRTSRRERHCSWGSNP